MTPQTPPRSSGEPILFNGAAIAAAVGAIIYLLNQFDVTVTPSREAALTQVVVLVLIPLVTWLLARRKTVTVRAANDAIVDAHQADPETPIVTFREGT